MRIREALGPLFADQDFVVLFPRRGQPAWPPHQLALVSVLQTAATPSPPSPPPSDGPTQALDQATARAASGPPDEGPSDLADEHRPARPRRIRATGVRCGPRRARLVSGGEYVGIGGTPRGRALSAGPGLHRRGQEDGAHDAGLPRGRKRERKTERGTQSPQQYGGSGQFDYNRPPDASRNLTFGFGNPRECRTAAGTGRDQRDPRPLRRAVLLGRTRRRSARGPHRPTGRLRQAARPALPSLTVHPADLGRHVACRTRRVPGNHPSAG